MDAFVDPLALLSLQIDWGADEALAEAPVNRLLDTGRPTPVDGQAHAAPATVPSITPAAPTPRSPLARAAEPKPQPEVTATTLDELCAAIRDFAGCSLRDTATNPVLPVGNPSGGLLIIGEPPVAEDDRSGRPFSGPAGAILDRILPALGLERDRIMLAPLIPWRPPGSRPPTDAELAQCLPLLHRLIAITAPRRIVLTGILPVRALLVGSTTLRRVRGRWAELRIPGLATPVAALPTAGLGNLRTAADRRDAWTDWRMLHRTIDGES